MAEGLVTIVVPVYKTERYLERCLTSIVEQTYTHLEILLIDDGSPDQCPLICEEWAKKDGRIRVIHKENAGLGMARNTGIENASGEYICFFDSDDYIDCTLIEKAYMLAFDNDADLVTFGFTYVDENGGIIGTGIPKHPLEGISSCTRMFSRKLLIENEIRYPSERKLIAEDCYAKYLWEIHVTKALCLPEPLYFYCRNYDSLSRTYRKDRFSQGVVFYEACRELLQKQNRLEEKQGELTEWFVSNTIAVMKQTIETDHLRFREKRLEIRNCIMNDTTQKLFALKKQQEQGIKRKVLFFMVGLKAYPAVYMLVWLQTKRKGKWR